MDWDIYDRTYMKIKFEMPYINPSSSKHVIFSEVVFAWFDVFERIKRNAVSIHTSQNSARCRQIQGVEGS